MKPSMPGYPPVYVANVFKNVGAPARGERYTSDERQRPFWKVGMVNGMMPGLSVDFFYDTFDQASRFRLWEEYTPSQLIAIGGRPWAFTCQQPYKLFVEAVINRYTDKKQRKEQWRTPFVAPNGEMIEFGWPTWAEAAQFRIGQGYTVGDLFGTLPASLAPLPDAVRIKLDAAREAQQRLAAHRGGRGGDRGRREEDALQPFLREQQRLAEKRGRGEPKPENNKITPTPPQSGPPLSEPEPGAFGWAGWEGFSHDDFPDLSPPEEGSRPSTPEEEAESAEQLAKEAADRLAAKEAEDAKLHAEETAMAAANALYAASWHPAGRPLSPTDVLWYITNGGAAGWYDGVDYTLPGSFLYQGGAGTWYGSYSRNGITIERSGSFTDVVHWR